jgi:L-alanine-DL-glutamate epimerase-like enolase superfamily enzyme
MQITHCKVTPQKLSLHQSVQLPGGEKIDSVIAIFVRLETRDRLNAWGCAVTHPLLTGEKTDEVISTAQNCADLAVDMHPTDLEYSLSNITPHTKGLASVLCAFDLAFYDLLGLAAGMPLFRLLGGYRNRIQTSVTIPVGSVEESVQVAERLARAGFRMFKIKGGQDAQVDIQRVHAIQRRLPNHRLRLDADGGYSVGDALAVTSQLKEELEFIEQPIAADDLEGLTQVTRHSTVPVLADQSVKGPASALSLAADRAVNGLCVKVNTCGGLHCARQVDSIARAARLTTMISCLIEPALLISAGLYLALSSPNVQYADLDGSLDLIDDPTQPGFLLEDGWLVASEIPGLGCTANL